MKLENEKFYIIKKVKIFILDIEKIICLFPNRDHVSKNKIIEDSFKLLENIYIVNTKLELDNIEEIYSLILTKINMLDFYLERAFYLKYISESQCSKLSLKLNEINKMVITWILRNNEQVE